MPPDKAKSLTVQDASYIIDSKDIVSFGAEAIKGNNALHPSDSLIISFVSVF
jgi:hypothetical protein